ncbi:MAG: DUF4270 domain-containing protein [Bacteroidia bacterium]|nr:DUF4270 family protein [Bacteroidia bacterium]MCZ2278412.1 DUF4270 domain-containing protein [Bacteroidia bacterium]
MSLFRTIFFLVFVLMAASCSKPDGLGSDLFPGGDDPWVNAIDTFTLETTFSTEDSIATRSDFNAYLLGGLNDPVFGNSGAHLYTTLKLMSSNPSFGSNPRCDSVKLSLLTKGYYGDTTVTHHFRIFKITELLYKDSTRYSHNKPTIESTPVSEAIITGYNPSDSIEIQGVIAPQLIIPVDTGFGTEILTSGAFASETAFNDYLKGLYITDSISGSGCVYYFDLREALPSNFRSKLIFYYSNDTTSAGSLTFELPLNGGAHFNYFWHDYSSAVFNGQFNDPVSGGNLCYIQSMAGIKTQIKMPFLLNLVESHQVSINRAVLEIKVDATGSGDWKPHEKLGLAGIDSSGLAYFLQDNIDNTVTFGGDLTSNTTYSFTVTRYLQQLLNNSRKNYGLYLVASGAAINANRTVIGGSKNPGLQMKLKVIFTSIN